MTSPNNRRTVNRKPRRHQKISLLGFCRLGHLQCELKAHKRDHPDYQMQRRCQLDPRTTASNPELRLTTSPRTTAPIAGLTTRLPKDKPHIKPPNGALIGRFCISWGYELAFYVRLVGQTPVGTSEAAECTFLLLQRPIYPGPLSDRGSCRAL